MAREGGLMIETAEKRYPRGYGFYQPVADYKPWEADDEFQLVYAAVREHTMVDVYRLYELWQLVPQAIKAAGDVLEVGSWRGGSGALLAARMRRLDPERRVYLADTFRGVVKAGPKDEYYRGGEHANTSADHVRALLGELDLDNAHVLEGIFPDETAHLAESERFCLCHIDVDVYQSAKDTAAWAWPRMETGAVLIYDDYGFYGCEGVTTLVHEELDLPDRTIVRNLNGHAVVVKLRN